MQDVDVQTMYGQKMLKISAFHYILFHGVFSFLKYAELEFLVVFCLIKSKAFLEMWFAIPARDVLRAK